MSDVTPLSELPAGTLWALQFKSNMCEALCVGDMPILFSSEFLAEEFLQKADEAIPNVSVIDELLAVSHSTYEIVALFEGKFDKVVLDQEDL